MIPCSGKNSSLTWCCGDSDECCTSTDQTNLVSLAPTFTVAVVTSTSSASTRTSAMVETTPAPETSIIPVSSDKQTSTTGTLPSVTSTPSETSGLSSGAKAGIAIGAIVGAVILVLLGVWISKILAWRRDAYAARAHNDPSYYTSRSDMEGVYGHQSQKYAYYAEADATTPPVEVAASPDPVEVPDNQAGFRNSRPGGRLATKYS
jgi:hypothetical protein